MTEAAEPRWLDPQEQRAWRAYIRATRLVDETLDGDMQKHGFQLTEYEILAMLAETPLRGLRMSVIADLVVQSRSRLTHTAARLEKRGLVVRRRSADDGRGIELVLTPEGRRVVDELAPAHVESVRRAVLDALSADELFALAHLLGRVRARLLDERRAPGRG